MLFLFGQKWEVRRDGKAYQQEYKRGIALSPVKTLGKVDDTGTIVSFLPDTEIFKDGIQPLLWYGEKNKSGDRAYLIAKLAFHLVDERNDNEEAHFYFEGGITSLLVKALNRNKVIVHNPIAIQKTSEDGEISLEATLRTTMAFPKTSSRMSTSSIP